MLLLKNACFIPELTQNFILEGDLLIKGNKISKIGKNIVVDENECITIDLLGKFLLPGFIDLHLHLTLSGYDVLQDNFKNSHFMALEAYSFAIKTLNAGFTTIRDVGSNYRIANSIRDSINQGILRGPNIISSGKILTPTESGNDYFPNMYVECDGVKEMTLATRKEIKYGADFIKLMGSGAIMNPGGDPSALICTDNEILSVVETAKFKNKYVAMHAHGTEAIKQAINCNVRTIEHASFIDEEGINKLLQKKDIFIIPTFVAFSDVLDLNLEKMTPVEEKTLQCFDLFKKSIKKAYDSGIFMGFGTDQGVDLVFHGDNGNEFIYRKEWINMKNIDILKQATINNAIISKLDHEIGDLKIDKLADLVILDGNPLEDISVCKNNIFMVIKNGIIEFNSNHS